MLSHRELATLMSLDGGDTYRDPFDLDVHALRRYKRYCYVVGMVAEMQRQLRV